MQCRLENSRVRFEEAYIRRRQTAIGKMTEQAEGFQFAVSHPHRIVRIRDQTNFDIVAHQERQYLAGVRVGYHTVDWLPVVGPQALFDNNEISRDTQRL